PFYGDQAFFLTGAKEMSEGLVLYRDFWDIKQPAIFYFYLTAGELFGFTEVGIHLFELFYWLLFAIVLVWFLKKVKVLENRYLISLAPLTIVGVYYSLSYAQLMTQVEILVNFPLLLVIVFNQLYLTSNKNKMLWLFLAGMAGGIVLFFKLMFGLILLGIWIYMFIARLKYSAVWTTFCQFLLIPLGVIVFWMPFLFYCYHHQILSLCFETYFIYPPLVLEHGSAKPVEKLYASIESFFINFALLIPFVVISFRYLRKHTLIPYLWICFVLSFIVVLLQKTSWYFYQFQLFYTPLILLSFISIDILARERLRFLKLHLFVPLVLFIAVLNGMPLIRLAKKLKELSHYNFALSEQDRKRYAFTNNDNIKAYEITRHFNATVKDTCPIFVVNDPLIYYYTNRTQAISQSGWSLQLFVPGQWELLQKELENKRPRYIFIRYAFNPYFETKGKKIMNWITSNYVIYSTNTHGIWYKLI
ncbi:MAG TPA: hypothetical protein VHO90_13235, partial [Bacteroidales bacterium]|nr:hypothetical protein [Bacteroidales bacterium]